MPILTTLTLVLYALGYVLGLVLTVGLAYLLGVNGFGFLPFVKTRLYDYDEAKLGMVALVIYLLLGWDPFLRLVLVILGR